MSDLKPPALDNSLWTWIKLWLYKKKEWIDQTEYRNVDGGTTHLIRRRSSADKISSKT